MRPQVKDMLYESLNKEEPGDESITRTFSNLDSANSGTDTKSEAEEASPWPQEDLAAAFAQLLRRPSMPPCSVRTTTGARNSSSVGSEELEEEMFHMCDELPESAIRNVPANAPGMLRKLHTLVTEVAAELKLRCMAMQSVGEDSALHVDTKRYESNLVASRFMTDPPSPNSSCARSRTHSLCGSSEPGGTAPFALTPVAAHPIVAYANVPNRSFHGWWRRDGGWRGAENVVAVDGAAPTQAGGSAQDATAVRRRERAADGGALGQAGQGVLCEKEEPVRHLQGGTELSRCVHADDERLLGVRR
jgi:hypothetical protein